MRLETERLILRYWEEDAHRARTRRTPRHGQLNSDNLVTLLGN